LQELSAVWKRLTEEKRNEWKPTPTGRYRYSVDPSFKGHRVNATHKERGRRENSSTEGQSRAYAKS
jgi:hypothetical protein